MRQSYISSILHQLLDTQFPEKQQMQQKKSQHSELRIVFSRMCLQPPQLHEYARDNTLHPRVSIVHPCRRVSDGGAKHFKLKRSDASTYHLFTNMIPKNNRETPWPNCCAHQQLCATVLQDVCPDTIVDFLRDEARLTTQSTMPPLN